MENVRRQTGKYVDKRRGQPRSILKNRKAGWVHFITLRRDSKGGLFKVKVFNNKCGGPPNHYACQSVVAF